MKEYILITGASSGIGYEMALQLAAKGYNLILVARRVEKLKRIQRELTTAYGVDIHFFGKDLSDTK